MTRLGSGLGALAIVVLMVGCGGGGGSGGKDMGPNILTDAFISTGCTQDSDCAPNGCQNAQCNSATKKCVYTDKTCAATDMSCPSETTCATVVCDPATGIFSAQAANDMMACTTDNSSPGLCSSGNCVAIPSCGSVSSLQSITCGPGSESSKQSSNDPNAFDGGAAILGSYACAPVEAGPELAFAITLDPSLAVDEDVTVSIHLVDDTGVVLADQTGVDLDLVILQDICAGTSTCMNPAVGTGFAGVTAGTSAERVTFHADHTKQYFAVVDGKDASQIGNFVIEMESCGQCTAVTTAQNLSCEMSMPVTGLSTSTGTNKLTTYTCADSMAPVVLAGNELPFLLKDDMGKSRNITATLQGATQPATLLVLNQSTYGACDPTDCIASKASASGTAAVTFKTTPTGSYERFWLLVDTPSTTDSTFGLEVACDPVLTAPSTWKCDTSFFNGGDGCDCGCGAVDPDCKDATLASCEYCADSGSCDSSFDCTPPTTINPTDNSTCK